MMNERNVPMKKFPGDYHLNKRKLIRIPGRGRLPSYQVTLNCKDPEDRALFRTLFADDALDVTGWKWQVLEGYLPGMESPAAQGAFEAIKTAEKNRTRAEKADRDAKQAFDTADALVRHGNDPEKFKILNKARIKAKQEVESSGLFLDTVTRHLEQKRRDLFTTLQEFQQEQVAELIGVIAPKAESFNEQIRAIVQAWNSEAAPLLKQLAQIDQSRPDTIYFEQLSLGELQLRELKSLRAFPTIRYRPDLKRFDFFLEVIA